MQMTQVRLPYAVKNYLELSDFKGKVCEPHLKKEKKCITLENFSKTSGKSKFSNFLQSTKNERIVPPKLKMARFFSNS